jgi:hypothetical protein
MSYSKSFSCLEIIARESLEIRRPTNDRNSEPYARQLSLPVPGLWLDRIWHGGRPLKFGLQNDNVQRVFIGVSRQFPFDMVLITTFISPK